DRGPADDEAGRREAVDGEDAGHRDERERDDGDAPVRCSAGGDARGQREERADDRGGADDPEMPGGAVPRPARVEVGTGAEDRKGGGGGPDEDQPRQQVR